MTESLEAAIAQLDRLLDEIEDPAEEYAASKEVGSRVDELVRRRLQSIALRLKADGKTWPEVGAIMGGVTYQRAHQISKGK